ncbi:hypothetical protein ASG43_20590 [Aureimonas sp. Leaf454]|uniref:DUF1353 domain-containing protein n=1 Tax=Aureimonas sp. Leaf454 TaxID=1736381 RepID=UPI0006F22AEB|nr:DUF1353 domain-containing protein [Aureimonas sp. Leaf454]KQT51981.1 hypothetical protein ASG43_20590 [Aureimonas sp. Leaf454]
MSLYTANVQWFEPAGGIKFRTTLPIQWERGEKGSGWWFTVPAGFEFDVSIPWALRWAFRPTDPRFLKAAALHDAMLAAGIDRLRAAAEFSFALKADGVGAAERLVMFTAVAVWRWS